MDPQSTGTGLTTAGQCRAQAVAGGVPALPVGTYIAVQHDSHRDPYDAECGTDRARRVGIGQHREHRVVDRGNRDRQPAHLEQVGRGRTMSASPWAPPQTGGQQSTPVLPPPQAMPNRPQSGPPPAGPPIPPVAPPPRPPRRGFPWLLVGGAVVLLIAAIAATAAITYAVARNTNAPTATPPPAAPTAQAPQFSTAEQNAAKQQLCQVFDVSTRGHDGQGGVRINGAAERTLYAAIAE